MRLVWRRLDVFLPEKSETVIHTPPVSITPRAGAAAAWILGPQPSMAAPLLLPGQSSKPVWRQFLMQIQMDTLFAFLEKLDFVDLQLSEKRFPPSLKILASVLFQLEEEGFLPCSVSFFE